MYLPRLFVAATALLVAACTPTPASAAPFADIGAPLIAVNDAAVAWGDYNNDDQMDLALAGNSSAGPVCRIYRNNGGVFTDTGADLTGVRLASMAWGDYDKDGDLDLAVSGYTNSAYVCTIYRNNAGTFASAVQLPGVVYGSLSWGDLDNDGDLDLAISGWTGVSRFARIYRNDGGSVFTDTSTSLPAVSWCTVQWGDCDRDGDLDLALSGWTGSDRVAAVYRNGGGTINSVLASLPKVDERSAWADTDNDGYIDLAQCGWDGTKPAARLLTNSGGTTFAEYAAGLQGLTYTDIAFGDYDNDGRTDLLLTGWTGTAPQILLYRNPAAGAWPSVAAGLLPVSRGCVRWGDYDNDGDLDLAMVGQGASGPVARIYRNDAPTHNSRPGAPSGLKAHYTPAGLQFTWQAPADDHTPSAGLSYEIRVGTLPRAGDVAGNAPAPINGFRRLPARGDISGTQWSLRNPLAGTYYWSVQAIDTSFQGSAWAEEAVAVVSPKSFSDGAATEVPSAVVTAAYPGYFYIESEDRAWGLRVSEPDYAVQPGDRVSVTGTLDTSTDGERFLQASGVTRIGYGVVEPLMLASRALGGADAPDNVSGVSSQKGVYGGVGLNNIGLLVRLAGRVTHIDGAAGTYNLDDGSGVTDSGGWRGVRVLAPGMTMPAVGDTVCVTGISSCFSDGAQVRRLLRVRREGDTDWITAAGPGPAPASALSAQRDPYRPWIVGLTWRASASTGSISYRIYRRLPGSSQFALLASTSALSYTDSAIPGDKVYSRIEYYVTAVDFRGIPGNPSNVSAVAAIDNPPPPPN